MRRPWNFDKEKPGGAVTFTHEEFNTLTTDLIRIRKTVIVISQKSIRSEKRKFIKKKQDWCI